MGLFFGNQKTPSDIKFNADGLRFPLVYRIHQKSEFAINNEVINESESDSIWNINRFTQLEDSYQVGITMEEHKVTKCDDIFIALTNFTNLFNIPLQNLILTLDNNGMPIEVNNQQDIQQRWQEVKEKNFSQYTNDKDLAPVIEGADLDFSNTIQLIQNSTLYILLFPNVYGMRNRNSLRKFKAQSKIFPLEKLEFDISEKLQSCSNIDISFKQYSEVYAPSSFEKKYRDSFGKLLKNKHFDYQNTFNANYTYSNLNGILKTCEAQLYEQAAEGLFSKVTISMQLDTQKQ